MKATTHDNEGMTRLVRPRSSDGFTLIELLMVMVILGILAAIAIPLYLGQRTNAEDTAAKSDLRSIAAQEEGYYTQSQSYGTFTQMIAAGISFNHLSPGVTVTIWHLAADGYCLQGHQTKSANYWYYDSQGGGLQQKGVSDCKVTTAPATDPTDSLSG